MATKGFAFGNHSLFEKGWRKLYFAKTRPREVEAKNNHPTNTRIGRGIMPP